MWLNNSFRAGRTPAAVIASAEYRPGKSLVKSVWAPFPDALGRLHPRSQQSLRPGCLSTQLPARPWPRRNSRRNRRSLVTFGKLFAGVATAGVLAGVLASGAMAAPAATAAATPTPKQATKDVFGGTVTAINETQLTVKNAKTGSKTFLRTVTTVVVKGRNANSSWSEIELNRNG